MNHSFLKIFYNEGEGAGSGEGEGEGVSLSKKEGEGEGTGEGEGVSLQAKGAGYDWEADAAGFGKLDLPEGFTMAGREVKGTAKDLIETADKRIGDLRQIIADKGYATPDAPEAYELKEDSLFSQDNMKEIIAPVHEMFKGAKMNQEQADMVTEFLGDFYGEVADLATKASQLDLSAHWNLAGEEFTARVEEVNAWANDNLPQETFEAYAKMGVQGVIAAENAMLRKSEQGIYKGPGTETQAPAGLLDEAAARALFTSAAYTDETHADHAEARATGKAHAAAKVAAGKGVAANAGTRNPSSPREEG